jgi:hypothetical protein
VNNNPAPGQIFYCNQHEFDEDDTNSFPTIIQNDGTILFARDLEKTDTISKSTGTVI